MKKPSVTQLVILLDARIGDERKKYEQIIIALATIYSLRQELEE